MGRLTSARRVRQISVSNGQRGSVYRPVRLLEEATLQANAHGSRVFAAPRLPGHDFELVNGFLLGEGIITDKAEVTKASFCGGADATGSNPYNTIDIELNGAAVLRLAGFTAASTATACGVAAPSTGGPSFSPVSPLTITAEQLVALPEAALRGAVIAAKTDAGVHAAVISSGRVVIVREDLTAVNAVDKLIGALLIDDSPTAGSLLFIDAALTVGVVTHALRAGFSGIATTGSPTMGAVNLCKQAGALLATNLSADRFNLYNGQLA